MKDIRPALRAFLLADPTVSSMVGGTRIHPVRLPQDQVDPSVVYIKVSETGDYHMRSDSGLGEMRMQIDAWAQTTGAATDLANAVYDRLTGARQIIGTAPDDVDLRGAFVVGGRDDYDEVSQLFRNSRDFVLWYGASE